MMSSLIPVISPVEWTALGASLANHLWQSTLFAGLAGLLTLVLKKNRAQVRYWLWLVASLKFLIPFWLFVGLGSYLSPSKASTQNQPGFSIVMQEVGQPFATAKPLAPLPAVRVTPRLVPTVLLSLWFSGCAGVLLFWWLRWRRISAAARRALPLESGREHEAQRRLEQREGFATQIKIATSASALEPGVVGIFHPVLLLPAGIGDRLTDAQLEAIIAHELCHVRRRDNLAAAIHMLVEALFWFHPLVWWMGARLVDERERACDEEVVRLGSEPQVYAESILKVCQFYLESPLVCVAGVTGSNLKRRIEDIMTHRIARKLDLGKKLLLATMGVAAVVVPVVVGFVNPTRGQAQAQSQPENMPQVFASVSIKPHPPETDMKARRATSMLRHEPASQEFTATNVTLERLIAAAYDLKPNQISGGPDWLTTETYDISAKVDESGKSGQIKINLQNLLADRFQLKFHPETKEETVYKLVVGTNGLKLKQVSEGMPTMARIHMDKGHFDSPDMPISVLADLLSNSTRRMVFDETGLKGNYEIALNWTPGDNQSVLTAVHEQLGLDLNAQISPIEHLIVDHAEKPSVDQAEAPSEPPSQANDPVGPAFATVSIQPSNSDHKGWWSHSYPDGRFVARNTNLKALIQTAYGITLISGPDALTSQRYDIDANARGPAEEDRIKLMLRTLLSTRFKLASHITTKEMPVYALVVGSQGPKFRLVDTPEDKCQFTIRAPGGEARIVGKGTSACLANIFTYLSQEDPPSLDRPVLDNTKLKGVFDFDIPVDLGAQSSFFAAVQQLGLKLEPNTAPIELLVVDHAEEVAEKRPHPL